MTYIPPSNFGMVEEDLYRSAEPSKINFPFLARLKCKTIIFLAPNDPSPDFLDFIEDNNINFFHYGIVSSKSTNYTLTPWKHIPEDVIIKVLNLICNGKKLNYYPCIIMCNLGRHRTGIVVGCLRRLQRWNLASIFEEYRRYANNKVFAENEQFIESFDIDLINIFPPRKKTENKDKDQQCDINEIPNFLHHLFIKN